MKISQLRIGLQVRHPRYGLGTVCKIDENMCTVNFPDQVRELDPQASEIQNAQPAASLSGLDMPLDELIARVVEKTADQIGLVSPDEVIDELGQRWQNGTLTLTPENPELQAKEIPLEVFFHKIVMIRNNLRVLEQKINSHPDLSDAQKVDFQQHITRSYGSMTTFNILFKEKTGQFSSK